MDTETPRFDFAPIERQLRLRCAHLPSDRVERGTQSIVRSTALSASDDLSDVDLGAVLGVKGTTVADRRREGLRGYFKADEVAVAAGFHPLEIWPDWA